LRAASGTWIAEIADVFVKNRSHSISGYLNLAALPIKALFNGVNDGEQSAERKHRFALFKMTGDVLEEAVSTGDVEVCKARAIQMIHERGTIVLQGFPLEHVAELCFKHNYRWRFYRDSNASLRFILEPGKDLTAPAKDSAH
jgi:hypothetical protein